MLVIFDFIFFSFFWFSLKVSFQCFCNFGIRQKANGMMINYIRNEAICVYSFSMCILLVFEFRLFVIVRCLRKWGITHSSKIESRSHRCFCIEYKLFVYLSIVFELDEEKILCGLGEWIKTKFTFFKILWKILRKR